MIANVLAITQYLIEFLKYLWDKLWNRWVRLKECGNILSFDWKDFLAFKQSNIYHLKAKECLILVIIIALKSCKVIAT